MKGSTIRAVPSGLIQLINAGFCLQGSAIILKSLGVERCSRISAWCTHYAYTITQSEQLCLIEHTHFLSTGLNFLVS